MQTFVYCAPVEIFVKTVLRNLSEQFCCQLQYCATWSVNEGRMSVAFDAVVAANTKMTVLEGQVSVLLRPEHVAVTLAPPTGGETGNTRQTYTGAQTET